SAWVVDLPTRTLVGAVATSWSVELPAIGPDGSLLVRQRNDLVAYRPDSLTEIGRVTSGGGDLWTLTTWRPRGGYRPTLVAEAQAATPAVDSVGPEGPLYVQVSTSQNDSWSSGLAQQPSRAALAAAWDVARAATRGSRRVALVDLLLETPTLHDVIGVTPTDGIVDAFEFGVSLNKTAHQVDGVFFIAAGSNPAHTGDVFANPRWRKLQGGFRVEGALLLLYVSAGGLARLSAVPDGLLALSPDGYEPESSIGQGIAAAMERGIPLLGVVRERWTPSAAAA